VTAAGPYLDTSALAKWYLNEPLSDEVDDYLRTLPHAWISSLTALELRCLLARRRRAGEVGAEQEAAILALFEQDVSDGYLVALAVEDDHFHTAGRLIARLPAHPLRTLDALHLAVVHQAGLGSLATADRVMADAAQALGLAVRRFGGI
jgi:uncharacterized protein